METAYYFSHFTKKGTRRNSSLKFPGGNLQLAWYRASTAEGFKVLARYWHKHDRTPARLRKITWLEVVQRYWRGTGHRYHASTEICTGSVLALLRSRLLADTWSQDWSSTMPVPRQPSARHQLSSTGIAPCFRISRSKYQNIQHFVTEN